MNGIRMNGIRMNGINVNGAAYNALAFNALLDNGINLNGIVTNYNDNTTYNGSVCLNFTGEPVDESGSGCTGGQCQLTSQQLALLVLSSLNSDTNNSSGGPPPPTVRFSDLARNALTGDNLPANMSLILSGAAGQGAQGFLLDFLKYTVSCAFNSNQSLTIQLEQPVVFSGSLGLAEWWPQRRIDAADQEKVSACLAARVNFFGARVNISIRGRGLEPPSADEIAEYTLQEGAFWGNIFAERKPELFACTNEANLENSFASLRFCSSGFPVADGSSIPCGQLRNVGSCDNWCVVDPAHPDEFRVCGRHQEVLSVYLPAIPQ